jgi:O-antigen/teichoic acid export membrane protein
MTTQGPGSRLIRNSVLTTANNILAGAIGWVVSIWVARQLGPTNYGIFSLVLWLSGTVSWALGLGFIHAITKFIAEYRGRDDNSVTVAIIFFVLKIELVLTALSTIVLVFLHAAIADYFFTQKESLFFLLAFLGLLPGMVTAVFCAALEGIQKFEYFLYANLIITPLSFAAKVGVLLMGWGISGLLCVMLIFSFVNVVFYWYLLAREGMLAGGITRVLPAEIRKRLLRYNASVTAILVCDKIVWDKSENFFLGRLCKATEVAYYNLGFNIAQKFVSLLPTTFWKVLFPAMSHYSGSGAENKMTRIFYLSTRYLAFFAFPMGVAGMILSFPLIRFLYAHPFIGAQRTLQIIFISSIFASLSNPASAVLYGYEKQSFIYKYGAILAGLNIALDLWLIKPYGALGAAICYGITTVFASVGGLIYTCRLMKLKYPLASVFKVLFATVVMGIAMELIVYRFQDIWGYLLAAIAGSAIYFISAIALGTFEKEDFALLESAARVLPAGLQKVARTIIETLSDIKAGNS